VIKPRRRETQKRTLTAFRGRDDPALPLIRSDGVHDGVPFSCGGSRADDSHYGRVETMDWAEDKDTDYVFGLAVNAVLDAVVAEAADEIESEGEGKFGTGSRSRRASSSFPFTRS
jgi:hypothetical protein